MVGDGIGFSSLRGETVPMANFDDDKRATFWSNEGYIELAKYINNNE